MAINFEELLTVEQKQQILQQRISQFAAEAWQHQLNKQTCQTLNDVEGETAANNALSVLEAAIQVHQDKLTELNGV